MKTLKIAYVVLVSLRIKWSLLILRSLTRNVDHCGKERRQMAAFAGLLTIGNLGR